MAEDEPEESLVTIVNPEEDGVTLELEFYDAMLEGVDGVQMPDPPARNDC